MATMSLIVTLILTGGAPVVAPIVVPHTTAVAIARARILSPAEARRVDGRLDIRTGERAAPTQVHRTARRDGGETADFY